MVKSGRIIRGIAPRPTRRAIELFLPTEYNFRPKVVSSKIRYKRKPKHREDHHEN